MNSRIKRPNRRPARLLTALLFPALWVGFASVGQAQESANYVITAQRPVMTTPATAIRDQLHQASANSVWMTHIDVRSDLDLKLGRPSESFRIATMDKNNRG